MNISTAQDLRCRVVISREDGETWPPLVSGPSRYDVTEVAIEVTVDDGEFRARPAYVQEARRIRADDSLGGPVGCRQIYSGAPGSPAWEQARAFRRAALRAAQAACLAGQAGDPADLTADAMRTLFDQVLAAARPGRRDHIEACLTDLLDLAADNLSEDARAEVIGQALAADAPAWAGERDWEVSLGTRIVAACSVEEAALVARSEWNEVSRDRYYEPDPNERYEVRPAYSRSQWQLVYPDKPREGRP